MDALGINGEYLIIQLIVCGIWPVLGLFALRTLRRIQLEEINKTLWALLFIAIPILGALAFFIVKPGKGIRS